MNRKSVAGIALTLLLVNILGGSFEIGESSSNPIACIRVEMPSQGYIPGIPVGQILKVVIDIESPTEWRNTENGIVGWTFDVNVDPEVLEPLTIHGSSDGYFLYDFGYEHGCPCGGVLFGLDKESGLFYWAAELILGWSTLGIGAGGDGKLCELWYKSKSHTAYTLIDIHDAYYSTAAGKKVPVEIVYDGHYNSQMLTAAIDIDPDTLNLKSLGRWITGYLQIPEEQNPEDIDVATILLNETIQPILNSKYDFVTNPSEYIVDHDGDGILERVVKFNRTEVALWIYSGHGTRHSNVALTITGELSDGRPFEATDTIKCAGP